MTETFDIAGYTRISVDDEQDQKNISIENQKAIIEDYVKTHFPGSTLTFFEDRDRSGYTFEQREGYQEMRRGLMSHKYDILIIKDDCVIIEPTQKDLENQGFVAGSICF